MWQDKDGGRGDCRRFCGDTYNNQTDHREGDGRWRTTTKAAATTMTTTTDDEDDNDGGYGGQDGHHRMRKGRRHGNKTIHNNKIGKH